MADANFTPIKRCTKCNSEKLASSEFFHAYKRSPDGLRSACRDCRAAEYAQNRDAEREKRKAHYQKNREKMAEQARNRYHADPESHRAAAMKRWFANHEANINRLRRRLEENREAINAQRREKYRQIWLEKYKKDVEFTLKHRMRSLVRGSLTKNSATKSRRMVELLGYDVDQLRDHLESLFHGDMTWDRFMAGEIHIDHKRPVAWFDITSETCQEFKDCWSLDNLQPMWAKENLSKGARYESS